jgi:uncharacterized protein YndB with AHSA1/START domain
MITVEYSATFAYPAATVFAALTNLQARPAWQPDLIEMRIEPEGSAQIGTRIFETRKTAGHHNETTFIVTVLEQDQRLTLETLADARQRLSESYWIEPLPDGNCRLSGRTQIDGVPLVAQFIVRQTLSKLMLQYFEHLKSVIASRS